MGFTFLQTVGYPLTIVGAIMGKNKKAEFNFPCRAKKIPREIPETPWYRSSIAQCAIGGFLPFRWVEKDFSVIFNIDCRVVHTLVTFNKTWVAVFASCFEVGFYCCFLHRIVFFFNFFIIDSLLWEIMEVITLTQKKWRIGIGQKRRKYVSNYSLWHKHFLYIKF